MARTELEGQERREGSGNVHGRFGRIKKSERACIGGAYRAA